MYCGIGCVNGNINELLPHLPLTQFVAVSKSSEREKENVKQQMRIVSVSSFCVSSLSSMSRPTMAPPDERLTNINDNAVEP